MITSNKTPWLLIKNPTAVGCSIMRCLLNIGWWIVWKISTQLLILSFSVVQKWNGLVKFLREMTNLELNYYEIVDGFDAWLVDRDLTRVDEIEALKTYDDDNDESDDADAPFHKWTKVYDFDRHWRTLHLGDLLLYIFIVESETILCSDMLKILGWLTLIGYVYRWRMCEAVVKLYEHCGSWI